MVAVPAGSSRLCPNPVIHGELCLPYNALQKMLQVHEQFALHLHALGFHSTFGVWARLYRSEHWRLVWLWLWPGTLTRWLWAGSTLHPEGVSSWSSSCLLFIGTAHNPTVSCQKAAFMTDCIPFPLIAPLSTRRSWISNYGWTLMCLLSPLLFLFLTSEAIANLLFS